jgi:hypothetical protein
MKQLKGSSTQAAPAATTQTTEPAPASTTPAPTAPAATTSAASAAPADGTAVPVAASGTLQDTDLPPTAGEGQLISFTRFESRDPFAPLVDDDAGEATVEGAPPATTTPTVDPTTSAVPTTPTALPTPEPVVPTVPTAPTVPTVPTAAPETPAASGVSLEVNGKATPLAVGDTFPASDPAFKVVEVVDSTSIKIGLVSGSFSEGVDTITLQVGKPVTLISQPDGARYTLKLVSASA